MRRLLFPILASAVTLGLAPAAFATAISINFTCGKGTDGVVSSGAEAGDNVCTINRGGPPSTGATPISSWTQSGFKVSVAPSSGRTIGWNASQGDPKASLSTGGGAAGTYTYTVTDGGGLFNFDSVQLGGENGGGKTLSYTITGMDGSTPEFTIGPTALCPSAAPLCSSNSSIDYSTIIASLGDKADDITSLKISVTDQTFLYLDNIQLTTVSEPSALYLLPGFLLFAAWAVFSRKTRFNL